jgi:hypothetical protein
MPHPRLAVLPVKGEPGGQTETPDHHDQIEESEKPYQDLATVEHQ